MGRIELHKYLKEKQSRLLVREWGGQPRVCRPAARIGEVTERNGDESRQMTIPFHASSDNSPDIHS